LNHIPSFPRSQRNRRHCEERSDEAIQGSSVALDCFWSLSSGGHSPDPLARNDDFFGQWPTWQTNAE